VQLLGAIEIKVCLINRDLLNNGTPSAEHLHHFARDIAVAIVAWRNENEVWATRTCNVHRCCCANTERARLIRGGANYATGTLAVANGNGLASERGIVANLNRREERVKVDVQNATGRDQPFGSTTTVNSATRCAATLICTL
jgi:hypothetical protein